MITALDNLKQLIDDEKWDQIQQLMTSHKESFCNYISDAQMVRRLVERFGWTKFSTIINDSNNLLYFLLLIPKEEYDYTTNHTELLRAIDPKKLQDLIKNAKQLYNILGCLTLDEGMSLATCLEEEYIIKLLDDPQQWNEILSPDGNLKFRNQMVQFILYYVNELVQNNERLCVLLKQMTIDETKACIELIKKEHCQNLIKNADELIAVLSQLNRFKMRTQMNDPFGRRLLADMSFNERLSMVETQQQLLKKLDHDQYLGTLFENIDQLTFILTSLNDGSNLPDSSILNYAFGGGPSQIQMKNQSIIISAIGSRSDILFKEHQQLLDVLRVLHPDCRIKLIEQLGVSIHRLASCDAEKKAILGTLNASDRLKIKRSWNPLSDLKKSLSVNIKEKDYAKAREDLLKIIDLYGNDSFTDCLSDLKTLSLPERQKLFESRDGDSILFAIMSTFIRSNEDITTNLDFLIESGIRLSEEDVGSFWKLSLAHLNNRRRNNEIDHIFNKIKTLPPIVTTELLSRPVGYLNANPFERILCSLICSINAQDRQLFERLYDEKNHVKKYGSNPILNRIWKIF